MKRSTSSRRCTKTAETTVIPSINNTKSSMTNVNKKVNTSIQNKPNVAVSSKQIKITRKTRSLKAYTKPKIEEEEVITPPKLRQHSLLNDGDKEGSPGLTPTEKRIREIFQDDFLCYQNATDAMCDVRWDCTSPDAVRQAMKRPIKKTQEVSNLVQRLKVSDNEINSEESEDKSRSLLGLWQPNIGDFDNRPKRSLRKRHGGKKKKKLEITKELMSKYKAWLDELEALQQTENKVQLISEIATSDEGGKKNSSDDQLTNLLSDEDYLLPTGVIKCTKNSSSDGANDTWSDDDLFNENSFLMQASQMPESRLEEICNGNKRKRESLGLTGKASKDFKTLCNRQIIYLEPGKSNIQDANNNSSVVSNIDQTCQLQNDKLSSVVSKQSARLAITNSRSFISNKASVKYADNSGPISHQSVHRLPFDKSASHQSVHKQQFNRFVNHQGVNNKSASGSASICNKYQISVAMKSQINALQTSNPPGSKVSSASSNTSTNGTKSATISDSNSVLSRNSFYGFVKSPFRKHNSFSGSTGYQTASTSPNNEDNQCCEFGKSPFRKHHSFDVSQHLTSTPTGKTSNRSNREPFKATNKTSINVKNMNSNSLTMCSTVHVMPKINEEVKNCVVNGYKKGPLKSNVEDLNKDSFLDTSISDEILRQLAEPDEIFESQLTPETVISTHADAAESEKVQLKPVENIDMDKTFLDLFEDDFSFTDVDTVNLCKMAPLKSSGGMENTNNNNLKSQITMPIMNNVITSKQQSNKGSAIGSAKVSENRPIVILQPKVSGNYLSVISQPKIPESHLQPLVHRNFQPKVARHCMSVISKSKAVCVNKPLHNQILEKNTASVSNSNSMQNPLPSQSKYSFKKKSPGRFTAINSQSKQVVKTDPASVRLIINKKIGSTTVNKLVATPVVIVTQELFNDDSFNCDDPLIESQFLAELDKVESSLHTSSK